MSEKPFWEGKTCKELDGLHVKITWNNGDTMTSTLNIFGNAGQCELSPARHPAATFAPYADIKSIELVDDPEYERIDDIHDVCKGDIFVATNGNRFSVAAVDDDDKTNSTLAIMIQTEDPDSYAWMFNSTFAYALRPKPKLPDHDGLWLDKGDGLWLVTGTTVIEIAPKDPPAASISYPASSIEASERLSLFAPFRPAKAVEA